MTWQKRSGEILIFSILKFPISAFIGYPLFYPAPIVQGFRIRPKSIAKSTIPGNHNQIYLTQRSLESLQKNLQKFQFFLESLDPLKKIIAIW